MPSSSATATSASCDTQPCSCCTIDRQAITADCLCCAGYLATSCAMRASVCSLNFIDRSPVDFAEHDVHGADQRHRVGDHVAARHLVERGQVGKARRADLQAVRLVGAVADQVDAELALRMLDGGVDLALGHVETLGEELEVVNQLFHVGLHLDT